MASEPALNADGDRIVCALRLTEIDGSAADAVVRLYLRSDTLPLEAPEYGQTLVCFGHIWPQERATNPHQFDSHRWLLSDGMTGMAAAKLEDVHAVGESDPGVMRVILKIRNAIDGRIRILFPANAELVRALVLGDRSGLDVTLKENFSRSGITHLICISGMHISVLATAVAFLLQRLTRRRTAVFVTIGIVVLYGALIGFPPSLVRAAIMFSVYSLAPLLGLPSDPITRLSAAMLPMLLLNPFYVYDGGFALSFMASAGIILLEPPVAGLFGITALKHIKPPANPLLRRALRCIVYFPRLLSTTLAAQLATLPLIISYFGGQSVVSIPANLIAIPLAMIGYPLALITLLASAVLMPLGAVAAMLPEFIFSLLTKSAGWFASLPFADPRIPVYPFGLLAAHVVVLVAASELTTISARIRRLLPVSLAAFAAASVCLAWLSAVPFSAVFLDADQADSAVVRMDGRTCIFDVGDEYSPTADFAAAECVGVDALFLSHPHYDHAGGLAGLLEELRPEAVYIPVGWPVPESSESVRAGMELAHAMGIPVIEVSAGDCVEISRNMTVFVHGPKPGATNENDRSLVLEARCGDTALLFTGDVSADGEPESLPDVDILKVAHHGSDTATSEAMLNAAAPEISVISVGDNNYGHPSDETIARLIRHGSEVYRTDQSGAITVTKRLNGSLKVRTYLASEDIK